MSFEEQEKQIEIALRAKLEKEVGQEYQNLAEGGDFLLLPPSVLEGKRGGNLTEDQVKGRLRAVSQQIHSQGGEIRGMTMLNVQSSDEYRETPETRMVLLVNKPSASPVEQPQPQSPTGK